MIAKKHPQKKIFQTIRRIFEGKEAKKESRWGGE